MKFSQQNGLSINLWPNPNSCKSILSHVFNWLKGGNSLTGSLGKVFTFSAALAKSCHLAAYLDRHKQWNDLLFETVCTSWRIWLCINHYYLTITLEKWNDHSINLPSLPFYSDLSEIIGYSSCARTMGKFKSFA